MINFKMSPREVYNSRIADFSASADRLRKLSDRLSVARLTAFAGGMVLFAVLLSLSVIAAVVTLTAALILFAWLVIKYETTEKSRKRYLRLVEINMLELNCLDGDFSGFKTGMAANHYKGLKWVTGKIMSGLLADTVNPGRDMLQRGYKCSIGCRNSDIETV